MGQRMNCFLEATFAMQQDQSIRNKIKYLMLLLSDLMSKYNVSAKSVANDLSSNVKKELGSVCKRIEEHLKPAGDNMYEKLSGNGEASDMFFAIVQPQQKSTVREKVKRRRESPAGAKVSPTPKLSDLTTSTEPACEAKLNTGEKYATGPVQINEVRRSKRKRERQDPEVYNTSKHPNDGQIPRKRRHRVVASDVTGQKQSSQ